MLSESAADAEYLRQLYPSEGFAYILHIVCMSSAANDMVGVSSKVV
jgi:hypothetical protein